MKATMKKTGLLKAFAVSALFVSVTGLSACATSEHESMASHNPMVGGAEMYPDRTVVENASNADNLTTLVAAVKAAGLADTLSGKGPFTVFAPTNAAFEKLPPGTVEALLKPENKAKLQAILTYHVVPAKATSAAAMKMVADDGGMHPAPTVEGEKLMLSTSNGHLIVEDANGNKAKVIQADVMQSNGVVHVIDTVLLPKM